MTGEGFVEFDLKAGRVVAAEMSNMAVSDVKDIKTGETKQRKLGTKYVIKLRNGSWSSRPVVAKSTDWWAETMAWGQKAVQVGQSGLAWLQTAALFGLQVLPKELEQFRPLIRRWAPWLGA